MTNLPGQVQALPQELIDEIYKLTFTPINGEHDIDRHYKPPSCLQVSHEIRKHLVKSYYTTSSIFYVSKDDCFEWLASLSRSHRRLVTEAVEVRVLDLQVHRTPESGLLSSAYIDNIYWVTCKRFRSLEEGARSVKVGGVDLSNFKIKAIDEVDGWTRWITRTDAFDLHVCLEGYARGRGWNLV